MALSTLYHTFSCHSEKVHDRLLKLDIFGITVSMGTIYVAAIYYGFICTPILQHSHLVVIVMIFLVVAVVLFPGFEFGTNVRNLTFFLWGSYGLFPTIHWAYTFGGLEQPIVVVSLVALLVHP
uniref:Uncharacterized protein n=1 Tax=Timema cristinae TaxID=61476 RepID=A0A7R9HDZ0_TIMCR|nr:unnamed protein product [Timema cristinae]